MAGNLNFFSRKNEMLSSENARFWNETLNLPQVSLVGPQEFDPCENMITPLSSVLVRTQLIGGFSSFCELYVRTPKEYPDDNG